MDWSLFLSVIFFLDHYVAVCLYELVVVSLFKFVSVCLCITLFVSVSEFVGVTGSVFSSFLYMLVLSICLVLWVARNR